ncbi:unnamed protein product [marine sediment metagenome]|uniref:Uncharacterized protein n=1 Tax=marine sediment metagenome TaxID=412755 RepID=X1E2W0_9ZZZZ
MSKEQIKKIVLESLGREHTIREDDNSLRFIVKFLLNMNL